MTLLPTCWWENQCEIQNLSGVLFGNVRLLRDFCTQQNIVEKHGLGYILLINRLIQQLKASSMWSLLPPSTHLHERFFLHPASMVGSCLIYKLGELTGQWFHAKLSPSSHWKFTEFRAETHHAFGIPNYVNPPCLLKSSPRNPSLPQNSKMTDAAHGMVWIFSGITHWNFLFIICWWTHVGKSR